MTQSSLNIVSMPAPGRVSRVGLLGAAERRWGALALSRLFSLMDQGLSGLANLVALAILGRALPVEQFGAIGMMIGLHYFVAGFHRSAIVLPYLTLHQSDPNSTESRNENSAWWWLSLGGAFGLSLMLALAALAVRAVDVAPVRWLATPLALAALVTPAMLAAEFARRWLFKIERADLVAVNAGLYFCALVGGAFLAGRAMPSAMGGAIAWALASGCSGVFALCVVRPSAPRWIDIVRLWMAHRGESFWLALANFPYAVFSSATIVILIGVIVGPVAAAVFTAARTLTNPAISIVSAIDSTDKPRAARALTEDGFPGLQHAIRRTRRLIAATTGLYLGMVVIWADQMVGLAFHGQYAHVTTEVRLLALAFFLAGLNQPSETKLIVLRAGRALLAVRTVVAGLAIAMLLLAAPWGVAGMAAAVAMIQACNLMLLWFAEHRRATREANG